MIKLLGDVIGMSRSFASSVTGVVALSCVAIPTAAQDHDVPVFEGSDQQPATCTRLGPVQASKYYEPGAKWEGKQPAVNEAIQKVIDSDGNALLIETIVWHDYPEEASEVEIHGHILRCGG